MDLKELRRKTTPNTASLKIWHDFDRVDDLIIRDLSGNGNDSTLVNAPTHGHNRYGKSYLETSYEDLSVCVTAFLPSSPSDFTVLIACSVEELRTSAYESIFGTLEGAGYFHFRCTNTNRTGWQFGYGDKNTTVNYDFIGNGKDIYTFQVVCSAGTAKLYINGELEATLTGSANFTNTLPIYLGGRNGSSKLNGSMKFFRFCVWDRILNFGELEVERKKVETFYEKEFLGFRPDLFGEILAWYDSQNLFGNHDTEISSLSEPIGGNTLSSGGAGKHPLLQKNSIGNKNSILFDGSNDYLTRNAFPEISIGENFTIFLVASISDFTAYNQIIHNTNAANDRFAVCAQTDKTLRAGCYNTGYISASSTTLTEDTPFLATIKFDGSMALRLNGANQVGIASPFTDNNVNFTLGYRWGASSINGEISEVIIFDSDLESESITKIEAYLSEKYNITLS